MFRPLESALKLMSLIALMAWLCWPLLMSPAPPLRIDMLSVGDGSCYIVRSGGRTVVFDAGSSTDLNVARRSLVPAMRRLGVHSIDAIAVTHADLDHYSAVLDLAEEFDVSEVLLTPQFLAEAKAIPLGPVAHAVEELSKRRVVIRPTAAGETRDFGLAHWTWLNPQPDRTYQKANDGSMVIRIDCGGRRVLLCGDIQAQTMITLLRDPQAIRADVVELPHHGSHAAQVGPTAELFIKQICPTIVMQSTGWARWRADKWAQALANTQRLVTVRDGACWVEVERDGRIETGRFLKPGHLAGGEE